MTAHFTSGELHALRTLTHAVSGGVFSSLNGGKFGHGFVATAFSPAIGSMSDPNGRVVVAALIGGAASRIAGGKRKALDAANKSAGADLADNEYGGLIYKYKGAYNYTKPRVGTNPCDDGAGGGLCVNLLDSLPDLPAGAEIVADFHSHPLPKNPLVSARYFSNGDIEGINHLGSTYMTYVGGYLVAPSGYAAFLQAGAAPDPADFDAVDRAVRELKSVSGYIDENGKRK